MGNKEIIIVLLDRFADWEAAFLAPALRGGVMPDHTCLLYTSDAADD